jgi:hypothetical protein
MISLCYLALAIWLACIIHLIVTTLVALRLAATEPIAP